MLYNYYKQQTYNSKLTRQRQEGAARMKLEQIEQAIMVAKTKSISLAAESLFISQPNLSLSIKKLEEEIGYPIFERTNKGVDVTPLGQNFIDLATLIMLQIRQLQNIGNYAARKSQQLLSIAHMHYRYVNHAAAELFNNHSDQEIRLEIHEGIRNQVISMVEDRLCDVGLIGMFSHYHKITIKQLETKGIQYFRLCSSPVTVLVGKGNPLYHADIKEVTLDMMREFPLVIFNEVELGPYTSILDTLGLDNQITRVVVSERATLCDMLDKTPCYSIGATNVMAYQNTDYYSDRRAFRLKDCTSTGEIGWIKRTDTALSDLVAEFLQILSSYFTVMNGVMPI